MKYEFAANIVTTLLVSASIARIEGWIHGLHRPAPAGLAESEIERIT